MHQCPTRGAGATAMALTVAALAALIAGCASSTHPSAGSTAESSTSPGASSTRPTTARPTTTPPAATPPTAGSTPRVVTAPHIHCEAGSVRHSYLGSSVNPVELCLTSGATATLRIDTTPHAWARPSLAGAPSLRIVSATSTSRSTTIVIKAVGSGVARIVAGPSRQWILRVAVVA